MRTKEDIEREAKEKGIEPGELLKQEQKAEEAPQSDASKPVVRMQHVFITLADGRRGVFMGPELIREIEFKLGAVPRPVAIDFEPPRAFQVPVPREEQKEVDNADPKVDKPAEARTDAPGSVEEKA